MTYLSKVMIKIAIILVFLFFIGIIADAGYTAIVIDNQLTKALNRGDIDFGCFIILRHLAPIVAMCCLIERVWSWKPIKNKDKK